MSIYLSTVLSPTATSETTIIKPLVYISPIR